MAASRTGGTGRPQLDDTSKAIIEQLQQDGRRPYASIGKAVGLSEAAVRQRVQKLIESGIVQIVAVTDPQQIGFARQLMIGINVDGDIEDAAADRWPRFRSSCTSCSPPARSTCSPRRWWSTTSTCWS